MSQIVVAHGEFAPEKLPAIKEVLAELVPAAQQEEGCVIYGASLNDTHLCIVEKWETQELFQQHLGAPALVTWKDPLEKLLVKPLEIIVTSPVQIGDSTKFL